MANGTYHSFDTQSINQALEAAHQHAQERASKAAATHDTPLDEGALKLSAQCISITVENGHVCINLPLGLGKKCLPVPKWVPNGTAGKACLDICTKWGIPCGVEVSVVIGGISVVSQHWGCAC